MPVDKFNNPIQDFTLIGMVLYVKTKLESWHRASEQEREIVLEVWKVVGL